jgi:hemerythrin-like domain-containing protein
MTDARAAEHRDIEARWPGIRQWLEAVEAGHDRPAQPADLEAFVSLCRRHMAQEDQELLAMAERLLSDEALADLAEAMRRRQVPD